MRLKYEPKRDMDTSGDMAERIYFAIKHYSPKSENILDLGTGEGHLVKKLREDGLGAFGIDLRELGQDRLIVADAKHLPFKSEFFDVVIDCYLIADIADFQEHTMKDIYSVLKEAKRVLKKGGLFVTVPSIRPIEFFDVELDNKNDWGFYLK